MNSKARQGKLYLYSTFPTKKKKAPQSALEEINKKEQRFGKTPNRHIVQRKQDKTRESKLCEAGVVKGGHI